MNAVSILVPWLEDSSIDHITALTAVLCDSVHPLLCSQFFHFSSRAFPPQQGQFAGRIGWLGAPARGDASISLANSTLQDNGTYTCSVRNPPDVHGSPTSHTVLTVSPKGERASPIQAWKKTTLRTMNQLSSAAHKDHKLNKLLVFMKPFVETFFFVERNLTIYLFLGLFQRKKITKVSCCCFPGCDEWSIFHWAGTSRPFFHHAFLLSWTSYQHMDVNAIFVINNLINANTIINYLLVCSAQHPLLWCCDTPGLHRPAVCCHHALSHWTDDLSKENNQDIHIPHRGHRGVSTITVIIVIIIIIIGACWCCVWRAPTWWLSEITQEHEGKVAAQCSFNGD